MPAVVVGAQLPNDQRAASPPALGYGLLALTKHI